MDGLLSEINESLFCCNDDDFEKYCSLLESRRSKIKSLREVKARIEKTNNCHKYEGRQLDNFRLWFPIFCDIQKEKEDSRAKKTDTSDIQPNEEEDSKAKKKDTSALRETVKGLNFNETCLIGPDISLERFEMVREVWVPLQRWFKKWCHDKPMDEDRKDTIRGKLIKSKNTREKFDEEWIKWTNDSSKTIPATSSGDALGGGINPEPNGHNRRPSAAPSKEVEQPAQPDDRRPTNYPESKKRKLDDLEAKTGSGQQHYQAPIKQLPTQLPQGPARTFKTTVDELCLALKRLSVSQWKVESLIPEQKEPPLGVTGGIGWCLITMRRTSPNLFAPAKTIQDIIKSPLPRDTVLDYLRNELFSDTELHMKQFSQVPLIFLPSGAIVLMTKDGMQSIGVAIKAVRAEKIKKKEEMLARGTMIFEV